jgi:hypothetical protein
VSVSSSAARHLAAITASMAGGALAGGAIVLLMSSHSPQVIVSTGPVAAVASPSPEITPSPSPIPTKAPAPKPKPAPVRTAAPVQQADPTSAPVQVPDPTRQLSWYFVSPDLDMPPGLGATVVTTTSAAYEQLADTQTIHWGWGCREGPVKIIVAGKVLVDTEKTYVNGSATLSTAPGIYRVTVQTIDHCEINITVDA